MVPGRNKVLLNKVEHGCRTPDSGREHLLPGCVPGSSDPDVGSGRVNPRLGEARKERPGNSKAFGLVSRGQVSQRGDRPDWVPEQGGQLFNCAHVLESREGAVGTSSP